MCACVSTGSASPASTLQWSHNHYIVHYEMIQSGGRCIHVHVHTCVNVRVYIYVPTDTLCSAFLVTIMRCTSITTGPSVPELTPSECTEGSGPVEMSPVQVSVLLIHDQHTGVTGTLIQTVLVRNYM